MKPAMKLTHATSSGHWQLQCSHSLYVTVSCSPFVSIATYGCCCDSHPLFYHYPFVLSLWSLQTRADIAASFQRTAIAHLTQRCRRAVAWAKDSHPEVRNMVVAGGVACNQLLRESLEEITQDGDLQLVCPTPRLCTDNGVMVAWAGVERSACISGILEYSLSNSMLAEGKELFSYPCAEHGFHIAPSGMVCCCAFSLCNGFRFCK